MELEVLAERPLSFARPDSNGVQQECYNVHQQKHVLKLQTVTTPYSMIVCICEFVVSCCNDSIQKFLILFKENVFKSSQAWQASV